MTFRVEYCSNQDKLSPSLAVHFPQVLLSLSSGNFIHVKINIVIYVTWRFPPSLLNLFVTLY